MYVSWELLFMGINNIVYVESYRVRTRKKTGTKICYCYEGGYYIRRSWTGQAKGPRRPVL
jgi:hypothetical protein